MIKTKVLSLLSIKPILQQLANTEMAARDSFMVLRLLKAIDKEYEIIEETQRKMLEAYGEKGKDGNYKSDGRGGIKIKEDSISSFNKEMDQLLGTEVTIENSKISLNLLDKLQLTPNQLLNMEDFIEE